MIYLVIAAVVVVLAGIAAQAWAEQVDRKRFPPPGCLAGSDENTLHIHCTGLGTPPVVLEAGIAASSVGWARVQPQLAELTHVCAYDRPGFGWSAASSFPRTPEQYLLELRAVVKRTGAPVILVGHSFGGLLVRLYAARYPEDVLGLVLVDPALLTEWANPDAGHRRMLQRGASLSRRGALLARVGFVRLSLTALSRGAPRVSKLFARAGGGSGVPVTHRLVGEVTKLPQELWPVIQSHWCRPASFRSMAEHLLSLPDVAAIVEASPLPSSLPVTVISGGHLTPEHRAEHAAIAAGSLRGRHVVAEGSGHWVHLDRPDLIVDAVRDLLAQTVEM